MNSILMGMQKTPLTNYGMKLLFIPCLLVLLSLSSFKKDVVHTEKTAPAFTDVYAIGSVGPTFTDLNGVEYADFWVEFIDENFNYVSACDINLNYRVWYSPTAYGLDSKYLAGCHSEYLVLHDTPLNMDGIFYSYEIIAGTGYIVY